MLAVRTTGRARAGGRVHNHIIVATVPLIRYVV